jgi:hypothetical protein
MEELGWWPVPTSTIEELSALPEEMRGMMNDE